ncbi:aromatase/cyclase [Micromonospora sp. NPDC050200]|uniref:aromatase/cyclase n=1 Tax=Micromonospora sp. NPDC050200 TaxID=3155664 RepID=UPI0033C9C0B7
MSSSNRHHAEHAIDVDAPVDIVYRVIADAVAWPQHFRPTIHVERLETDGTTERLQIWATANDAVKTWTSRRVLDEAGHRVTFRQEVSAPPVASMGGEWLAAPRPYGGTRLTLRHDFTAMDDDPEGVAWIRRATDRNSDAELANIKAVAERWDRLGELAFSFDGSVTVDGPMELAYDFLHQAARWPERLPHVARLNLREDVEGIQHMAMDTRANNGSVHTTESVRVCFPGQRIVYKQLVTPALMTAHTGEWVLEKADGVVLVTSRHTIVVNESAITGVLGPDATVASARAFLQNAIGTNSEKTLRLAKAFAEAGGD